MKKKKNGAFVTLHRRAWLLKKAQVANRLPNGTSSRVTYCPSCGAPMVDSAAGQLRHQRRSPKCMEAK